MMNKVRTLITAKTVKTSLVSMGIILGAYALTCFITFYVVGSTSTFSLVLAKSGPWPAIRTEGSNTSYATYLETYRSQSATSEGKNTVTAAHLLERSLIEQWLAENGEDVSELSMVEFKNELPDYISRIIGDQLSGQTPGGEQVQPAKDVPSDEGEVDENDRSGPGGSEESQLPTLPNQIDDETSPPVDVDSQDTSNNLVQVYTDWIATQVNQNGVSVHIPDVEISELIELIERQHQ